MLAVVGIGTFIIINVVMAIVMAGAAWGFSAYEKGKSKRAMRSGKLGPTYEFDIMSNSAMNGNVKQVIYGTHRIGGQVLQQFTRQFVEGIDLLYTIIGLGWGALSAINPNGNSDLHVDGNTSANYRGLAWTGKTGTNSQTVVPHFQDVVTTTAMNSQLLYGAANAVTCVGTANADEALVKITFVSGMYYVDGDGHRHSTTFWLSMRYRLHDAGGGIPGAWSAWAAPDGAPFSNPPSGSLSLQQSFNSTFPGTFTRRRYEPFSIWAPIDFPTTDTYDTGLRRDCLDHDGTDVIMDSYIKEYQEIEEDELSYPNTALVAIEACATDQLSGAVPRFTSLVQGRKIMGMSSATVFTAPALSNNPAEVILDMVHNSNYGAAKYLKPRMDLTLNTVAGGPFTVGEIVKGPANDYQWKGIVRTFSGTSMTLEATQGVPYTSMTGQTSGATANLTSVDSSTVLDLTKLWAFDQFCDEQAPNGGTPTTVDNNSASGQKVLNVASTTTPAFIAGDTVVINYGGAREEDGTIDTVQAGVSITLLADLTYAHTALQADEVSISENRMEFDFVFDGEEDLWGAIDRVCNCSRAIRTMKGSQIQIRKLGSESPVQLVCKANMNEDSLSVSYRPFGDRPNMLNALYLDQDYDYRKMVGHFEDPTAFTNSEKMLSADIDLYGITRSSQVNREILFRLKRLRFTGKHIKFGMGVDYIKFEVGDVFRFAHDTIGMGLGSGLVESSTNTTVTIDHPISGTGGQTIRIRQLDGTEETQTLAAVTGSPKTLTIAAAGTWTTNPVWGTIWAIGTLGRFRCISIEPAEANVCEIVAEEDDTSYYIDDYGVLPTFTETVLQDPDVMPPDVENLTLALGTTINNDKSVVQHIDVHFTKPEHNSYSHAEIHIKAISGLVTVAGSPYFIASSVNGEFNAPKGVCADGTYVYIADKHNHRIAKLNQSDLSFVANLGSEGVGNAQFKYPSDVCTDGTHIWVADTENNRIQKLTVAGVYVDHLGGVAAGVGNDQFDHPWGICTDTNTSLICVADSFNHRLIEIDDALDGFGGAGTWNTYGTQGAGNDQFERPMGIDTDESYYYVADTGNDRIKKVTLALAHDTIIGTTGTGDNNFASPTDIAVNDAGTLLYVADTFNHRYHRRDPSDLSYIADIGEAGFARDQFEGPRGICHNGDFIFIAEHQTHRVQIRDDEEDETGGYEYKGLTTTNAYRVEGEIAFGEQYRVSVVSVSAFASKKNPEDGVTKTIMTRARNVVPPNVTNFTASNAGGSQVTLSWTAVLGTDVTGYLIKAGATWAIGQTVSTTGITPPSPWSTTYSLVVPAPAVGYSVTYWIVAITSSSVESATPASTSYTTPYSFPPIGWNFSYP